jgi:hypothetical protein
MSKTVLSAGAVVNSAYLNAINGVDGSTGIVHDGANTNGHAPKIDPVAHISGITEGEVVVPFWPSCFTTQLSTTVRWKKEDSTVSGKPSIVTLSFSAVSGTSAANSLVDTLGSNLLPTSIRPKSSLIWIPFVVVSNGFCKQGMLTLFNSGSFVWAIGDNDQAGFSTTGEKGFPEQTVQYPVYP